LVALLVGTPSPYPEPEGSCPPGLRNREATIATVITPTITSSESATPDVDHLGEHELRSDEDQEYGETDLEVGNRSRARRAGSTSTEVRGG
jgi:hypothetical protein